MITDTDRLDYLLSAATEGAECNCTGLAIRDAKFTCQGCKIAILKREIERLRHGLECLAKTPYESIEANSEFARDLLKPPFVNPFVIKK